ncbi:NAD(P)/FAD-dependent oxidoreductase [Virgibacillus sp. MSP4-1]|uniref:NAD(P)/FAD-dependent oxidoreductase n=1 Tax=Virgibacillus sp. MSP4-1 TaxID=2700081 RepID=UPI0003AAADFB|nr:NAD(P)/FAD-dependent oxidoreductase [Virgibacillus sp. MSP4-1]QHS21488.1 NAD(P)/FAD-dependent oxidoreductase [Virgibacillus sp. MSP4-1]
MENQPNDLYDVTIIGGGPAGLFSAFYSGMREMKTKVIEYLPFLGGKVPYFYPEKIIRDIGGIPQISGETLTEQLVEQAMTFHPSVVLGEQCNELEQLGDGTFVLTSDNGNRHYTRTVILATGFGALKSVKLDVSNAHEFEGHNLRYSPKRLHQYKGKHVLISGGGNSAVDWANELEAIAEQVTLVYRKNDFSGIESNISKMKDSSVHVKTPYLINGLKGDGGEVTQAELKNVETGETEVLSVDEIIVNHGFEINLGKIGQWGLKMEDGGFRVNGKMETSIPGVFAVGDIADYENKLPLIAGGFNEGPIAVNNAKKHIHPDKELSHLYSTQVGACHHPNFVE